MFFKLPNTIVNVASFNHVMNKKQKILNSFVVSLFLVAFINVYVTDYLCNNAHLIDLTGQEHDHILGHDHHHGKATAPNKEHNHSDKHEHDNNSTDNCCNDLTTSFYSSLTNPISFNIDFNSINIGTTASILYSSLHYSTLNNSRGLTCYQCRPPPKIADTRIFIQSLLI